MRIETRLDHDFKPYDELVLEPGDIVVCVNAEHAAVELEEGRRYVVGSARTEPAKIAIDIPGGHPEGVIFYRHRFKPVIRVKAGSSRITPITFRQFLKNLFTRGRKSSGR